jgi:hypothetical protein
MTFPPGKPTFLLTLFMKYKCISSSSQNFSGSGNEIEEVEVTIILQVIL